MNPLNQLPGLLTSTCDTLNKSVSAIDPAADVSTFISENKNAAAPPPPAIEYEPYDSEDKGKADCWLLVVVIPPRFERDR